MSDQIELPRAAVGRRLGSSALDAGLLYAGLIVMSIPIPALACVDFMIAPIIATAWLIRDLKGGQLSPGKQMGHFQIVDINTGELASNAQCVGRNAYYAILNFVAIIPFLEMINLGFFALVMAVDVVIMITRPDNRRIGDLMAGTQVVPTKS